MSVNFKVGFTISGETLFALIAKMLPIDDLSVEEIPTLTERSIAVHKLTQQAIAAHRKPQAQRKNNPLRLNMGINGIVLTAMKDKPMKALELQPLIVAAGFSANSINSRLEALRIKGIIERVGDGRWRVVDAA